MKTKTGVRSQESEARSREAVESPPLHPSSFILHPARSGASLSSERGIALVMTLAVLVLVTLMMIGFAVSMRVESIASKNFNDLIKARQLAQGAVDHAVATLRQATPVISNTSDYVTMPGLIYTRAGNTWTPTLLFTTNASPIDATNWVNLDANNVITGPGSFYSTAGLTCGWVNVLLNPSAAPGTNNPMIGRYAYWVDDESTKINVSVANTRGSDPEGHAPAAIDLTAVFTNSTDVSNGADGIVDIRNLLPDQRFETLPSLYLVPRSNVISRIPANQFHLTAYSTSPNLTPWGAPRLNVAALVNSPSNAAYKITAIANALSDSHLTDWYGKTFADKYPSVQQIAANIIDFTDADSNPTDSGSAADVTPPAYLGLDKTPYINEFGFSNSFILAQAGTSPTNRTVTVSSVTSVELWYPYTTGASWSPPAGTEIVVFGRPGISFSPPENVSGLPTNWIPGTATFSTVSGMATDSFQFATLNEGPFTFSITGFPTTVNFTSGIITAILRSATGRIDYQIFPVKSASFTVQSFGSPVDGSYLRRRGAAVNDPRARWSNTNNWNALDTSSLGTLGQQNPGGSVLNAQVTTTNGTVYLRADGDRTCHQDAPNWNQGTFYPGDISFIHAGVPWRTFWLQPQWTNELGATPLIPDWAALDLFTQNNPVGRINVNAYLNVGNAAPLPSRLAPLYALLTNITGTVAAFNVDKVVNNIYTNGYINDPAVTFSNRLFSSSGFTTVGELCEVTGLATNDVAGSGDKQKSEIPIRGIANLVTTRANVFNVWAIAQSLKATAVGTNITGEAKIQAIVERYEEGGLVKFRTKYFRYIYE